jgi:hypothetical protein
MNVWRCLGASLFVVILGLGISVQGQEKKAGEQDKKAGGQEKKPGDQEKKPGDQEKKPQPAGDKIVLALKAFDGTTSFWQEMTTSTEQTMKVSNMEVKQKQSQTFWVEWTPVKKTGDEWTVKQKIIGVRMDIEIGGNKISYDSTSKEPPPANPLTDFFKNLKDSEFTLHINSKDLKVTKIEGQDEFINKLSKANPALQPLLKAILSEKALQQMADPIFAAIPPDGVVPAPKDAKGKPTWQPKPSVLDMGPIGIYTTTNTYTFEGLKDSKDHGKVAEISVSTTLDYTAPAAKTGTDGLPFRIASGKLSTKKGPGTGTVVFNMGKGLIQSSDMSLELEGDLTIEIAGMTTDVNLSQKQKSSLKTSEKRPIP